MNCRPLALLVSSLVLVACAAPRESVAPTAAAPEPASELMTYRASLASVPAGAARCRVAVRWPDEGPTRSLRAVQAFGLVGNAAFTLALDGTSTSVAGAHAQLVWEVRERDGERIRELVVETRGKPLELGIALARPAGLPLETHELEEALARGTTATADGQALADVATRLDRQVK